MPADGVIPGRPMSAAATGMAIADVAERAPRRLALDGPHGRRTFGELNARANRLARAWRAAGLRRGDVVAVLVRNRPELAEAFFATQRTGLRFTPVNWHLKPADVAYVVRDSGARALVADVAFAEAANAAASAGVGVLASRAAVGGTLAGFTGYEALLAAASPDDLAYPSLGDTMLYTSGTTGRPKGVRRALPDPARAVEGWTLITAVFGFRPDGGDVALATGPLYHSGPLNLCLAIPVSNGVPTYLMDKWDAEEMLRLVEERRVTHTYCVPTMFRRLLALPDAVRRRYDVSSLRFVIHGAAPCGLGEKRAMIDWLGPIVTEIYAATEGMGTIVTAEEWLRKPGTVGRPAPGQVRILDEHGRDVAPGETGTVFLRAMDGAEFEYHGDPVKTAASMRDGCFTVGDLGRLDADGHLFLTGRSAEVVVTGGTNVYPAEIDPVVTAHPLVADAAVVGVPDPEWGEVVAAAIVPAPGAPRWEKLVAALEVDLADCLPTHQRPRRFVRVDAIPRSEAGKLVRRELRDALAAPGTEPAR